MFFTQTLLIILIQDDSSTLEWVSQMEKSIRIFIHDEINLTDVVELNAKFIAVQTYWKAKKL